MLTKTDDLLQLCKYPPKWFLCELLRIHFLNLWKNVYYCIYWTIWDVASCLCKIRVSENQVFSHKMVRSADKIRKHLNVSCEGSRVKSLADDRRAKGFVFCKDNTDDEREGQGKTLEPTTPLSTTKRKFKESIKKFPKNR